MVNDFVTQEDLSLFTTGNRFVLGSLFLKRKMNDMATFDLFVREMPKHRNYLVAIGLEHAVQYLKNLRFNKEQLKWIKKSFDLDEGEMKYFGNFKFTGDVWTMPEGTIFFPNEPIMRITAPIVEAQLIEMFLINNFYYQIIAASKIARFVDAANNKSTVIGYNRSYGTDAAMKSSRVKDILGVEGSSALSAFKNGVYPYSVSTYHYLIMFFNSELEAFRSYLKYSKGKGLVLVDTYDSIQGIKNFIKAAKELEKDGLRANGIQLDSGDLYDLSKRARKMFDEAGLDYLKIFAMSNLDEYKVAELERKGAPIDIYAGTTELLTPVDAPTLELVYKLSEIERNGKRIPKMKTATKKVSLPGRKQVYRVSKNGKYQYDVIGLEGEKVIGGQEMLQLIIKNGKLVKNVPGTDKIKEYYFREKTKFNKELFNVNKKVNYSVKISEKLKSLAEKTRKAIIKSH